MVARTFTLPDLGEGLEDAAVDAWLVAEGDTVVLDQPIAEIETAKATVEIPSPFAGRVVTLHAAAGSTVKVGDALVTIEVETEASGTRANEGVRQGEGAPPDTARDLERRATEVPVRRERPPRSTPATRSLAKRLGVNLSGLAGSGPDGRITREDVEAAAAAASPAKTRQITVDTDAEVRSLTAIRRTAAERLAMAAAVPAVTTWRTVDCSALERSRRAGGLSPLPFLVRALADVCIRHPSINASWSDGSLLVHRRVHVGIATDTERGLLVPVVHDADRLSITDIAVRIARLASAARDGTIEPADMVGHTITVTNTGSYGSEAGTPLLNPPDAVVVALGAIGPRPLVVDGEVRPRPACTLSVTFDHRVLDGAGVGRALNDLVAILEDEASLRSLGPRGA